MRILLALILLFVTTLTASSQAIWRNFFTVNANPIVDVVAGSNATVVATTPAVNIRRFTVSSTATGGAQTNRTEVNSQVGGNIAVVTNTAGGITLFSLAALTDTNVVGLLATNAANGVLSTNVPVWAQNSTSATYVTTAVLTNKTYASNVIGSGTRVFYSGNNFAVNLQTPFYGCPLAGNYGWGNTLATYSNVQAVATMTISNLTFSMAGAALSGTNITFTIMTNSVDSNLTLTLLAGSVTTNDTSGSTLTIPAGTYVQAKIQHSAAGGSIGTKTFLWGWAY